MLAIELDAETEGRLEPLARLTGRPQVFHAREAILQHLEDLEDAYLAGERIATPARTYSADEVKGELGL